MLLQLDMMHTPPSSWEVEGGGSGIRGQNKLTGFKAKTKKRERKVFYLSLVAVVNIVTRQTEEERNFFVFSVYALKSIIERNQGRNLKLAAKAIWGLGPLPRDGTAHSGLGPPTSVNQENAPQMCPGAVGWRQFLS